MIRSTFAVSIVLMLAGCNAAFEYPSFGVEDTAGACADGEDGDFDGLVDCHDPDCAAHCVEDDATLCRNGEDDDVDGLTDCRDPDCDEACVEDDATLCKNGNDDDEDGLTDCRDPECAEACVENDAALCKNGDDDDGDGLTDCRDPDCDETCVEDDATLCDNDLDDDGDDQVDCSDPDCTSFCPESGAAACSNILDDDLDALTDCDDEDCDGHCEEITAAECTDTRDNDGDGLTDAADARCWAISPLTVQRCTSSPSVSVASTFDQEPDTTASWFSFGSLWSDKAVLDVPQGRDPRADRALVFALPSPSAAVGPLVESSSGGMALRRTLAGTWNGLTLDASVRVPERTWVRFLLMPIDLSPEGSAPLAGDEAALLVVEIDARVTPPTFSLNLASTRHATAVESTPGSGWYRVSVVGPSADAPLVTAVLTPEGGDPTTPLEAPMDAQAEELPPSRLVISGASAAVLDPAGFFLQRWDAAVDDVSVTLTGRDPCGVEAPQIPGDGCIAADHGHFIATAPGCALVSAAAGPTYGDPQAVVAWHETNALTWTGPPLDSIVPSSSGTGGASGSGGTTGAGGVSGAGGAPPLGGVGGAPAVPPPSCSECWAPGIPYPCCTSDGQCGILVENVCVEFTGGPSSTGTGGTTGAGGSAGAGGADPGSESAVFEAPSSATLAGAALVRVLDGTYRALLAWRTSRGISLETRTSPDCQAWTEPADATLSSSDAALPTDIESLSLVHDGSEYQLFFTRPPNDEVGRTLWLATSPGGSSFEVESHPLAELPESVIPPVSIHQVGGDLVAVHALGAGAEAAGIGALVATPPALDVWDRVLPFPLLEPSHVTGAFDADQLVAGALGGMWSDGSPRWPLLYSGRVADASMAIGPAADPRMPVSTGGGAPTLFAGTAFLEAAGGPRPGGPSPIVRDDVNPQLTDVEVPGWVIASDSFDPLEPRLDWQFQPETSLRPSYFSELGMAVLDTRTMSVDLGQPIVGDFELRLSYRGSEGSYSNTVRFGLTDEASSFDPLGLAAQVMYGSVAATAFGTQGTQVFYSTPLGAWTRIYLRRTGGTLRAGRIGEDGCTRFDESVLHFLSSTEPLDTVYVKVDVPLEVDEIVLYGAGDPGATDPAGLACEEGARTLCQDPSGAYGCVSVETDGSHCGDCDTACGPGTLCVGGECRCPGSTAACDGTCVDLNYSPQHCGACNNDCGQDACVMGSCLGGTLCTQPLALTLDVPLAIDLPRYPGYFYCDPYSPSPGGVWLAWTAPADGSAHLEGSNAFSAQVLRNGCPGSAYPQVVTCIGAGFSPDTDFAVVAGETYWIQVGPAPAPLTLTLSMTSCPTPTVLPGPGTFTVDLSAGLDQLECSLSPGPVPVIGAGDADADAVLTIPNLMPREYRVRLDGVTTQARIGVINGSCAAAPSICSPMLDGEELVFTHYAGTPVTLVVEHAAPAPASVSLTIEPNLCPGEVDAGSALGVIATGTMADAPRPPASLVPGCPVPAPSFLYSWTAPAAGVYRIHGTGSSLSPVLGLIFSSCAAPVQQWDGCGYVGGLDNVLLGPGQPIWILVTHDGTASPSDTFVVNVDVVSQPCMFDYECPPPMSCIGGQCLP